MDKARFNLRTLFSSPLNRRRLLTRVAPVGATGAMLGTFAPLVHAQEQHSMSPSSVSGLPQEGSIPNLGITQVKWAFRTANVTIAHQVIDDTYTFGSLNSTNVFAFTTLTEISAKGTVPIEAWAYFSEYSDSTGKHDISGQRTTALWVEKATSITVKTHGYSAFVASLTTIWLTF